VTFSVNLAVRGDHSEGGGKENVAICLMKCNKKERHEKAYRVGLPVQTEAYRVCLIFDEYIRYLAYFDV
jgi:hypothetical protein